MGRKLYFAHPVNTYDTKLEEILLNAIAQDFAGWEIENPNQQKHQDGYMRFKEEKGNGMLYFVDVVLPACDGGIFLPFRDSKWSAGVAKEAMYFLYKRLPAWQISLKGNLVVTMDLLPRDLAKDKVLSVEETRARLRDTDGNPLPY
ncbi:MAG: hypothetical protein WDZ40_00725 [Candidatus Spechtbacterales bacterium]